MVTVCGEVVRSASVHGTTCTDPRSKHTTSDQDVDPPAAPCSSCTQRPSSSDIPRCSSQQKTASGAGAARLCRNAEAGSADEPSRGTNLSPWDLAAARKAGFLFAESHPHPFQKSWLALTVAGAPCCHRRCRCRLRSPRTMLRTRVILRSHGRTRVAAKPKAPTSADGPRSWAMWHALASTVQVHATSATANGGGLSAGLGGVHGAHSQEILASTLDCAQRRTQLMEKGGPARVCTAPYSRGRRTHGIAYAM